MFKLVQKSERKAVFQTCIFMAGPLIVFFYSHLPIIAPINLFAIGLSVAWVYLSVEDVLKLSVPTAALYLICTLTCVYALLGQKPLWDYFLLASYLSSAFLTIWLLQAIKSKTILGFADYFVMISLGSTLQPHMLGPWLLIACSIPLIGLISRNKRLSEKLPFIPYLTVGWMLASTLT